MNNTNLHHRINLFVSTDDSISEEVAESLIAWGEGRSDCTIEIIPVLSRPEQVIRLQIFYTPALVINGTLIAGGISSPSDLSQFLPADTENAGQ